MFGAFSAIPEELRLLNQWVCWRLEDIGAKKPTKVPYNPKTGYPANVNDPSHWSSFEEAFNALALGGYSGLGFMFSEADPYTFIDLDNTEGDQAAFDRHIKIFHEMDSYSEISPSGKGLHIIVKGKVPSGRRRSFIEVYSSQRYATMTGLVHNDKPIVDRQDMLTQLWTQMGGTVNTQGYTGDDKEIYSDEEIIRKALDASNGEKFDSLRLGNWQAHYSSQSEADFAFIDIIAFYTQNKAQVARIFRSSALGQRDKAKRVDYVERMILRSFDRMLPPIDFDGFNNAISEIKANNPLAQSVERGTLTAKVSGSNPEGVASSITAPPGLVGQLAQFIYAAAPRPVPEIALAGALGLMAGICGKAFNISNTGLNQYILLLAKTGMGKEGMAAGIDKLMSAVKAQVPTANEFIGPSHISSGQALVKFVHKNNSFVSILGEFGLRIQNMSAITASSHERMLKQILLELYNKSGGTDVYRASIYADSEKNSEATIGPAFSILGESVPTSFYNALSEEMISEGLLPRFMIIEYEGIRPGLNKAAASTQPPIPLVDQLASLCAIAKQLMHSQKVQTVRLDDQAQQMSDTFDQFATDKINQTTNEVVLNLWNRAHLKALKLSALIAVGVNMYDPVVTKDILVWAIDLVQRDIKSLTIKFESGEVGQNVGENRQQIEIIRMIKEYIDNEYSYIERYMSGGINPATRQMMHSNRVVPYSYISRRLIASTTFRNDKAGSTGAIKRVIQTMVDSDKLREVPRHEMQNKFGSTQRAFMISDLSVLQ